MNPLLTMLPGLLFFSSEVNSQPYASWTKAELKLNNNVVERVITLPQANGNFITTSYKPVNGKFDYFQNTNSDFQFEINGKVYSGKGNWSLKKIANYNDNMQGDGAAVTLLSNDKKIEVTVQYLLYP